MKVFLLLALVAAVIALLVLAPGWVISLLVASLAFKLLVEGFLEGSGNPPPPSE